MYLQKVIRTKTSSESISQRHGSADPDPDPDPHQNVMDPQHWPQVCKVEGDVNAGSYQNYHEWGC